MILYFISAIENEDDRDLATQLYEEYEQRVYKIALSFFRDVDRAEEGVNDVFERVCKNIVRFRALGCNETTALIVSYSKNLFTDTLRRDKVINFEELDEYSEADTFHVEDFVVDKERFQSFVKCIKALDQKYADVCDLKYLVGMNDADIAEVLNISPGNVRVRLHRSKAMIIKQLSEEGIEV